MTREHSNLVSQAVLTSDVIGFYVEFDSRAVMIRLIDSLTRLVMLVMSLVSVYIVL